MSAVCLHKNFLIKIIDWQTARHSKVADLEGIKVSTEIPFENTCMPKHFVVSKQPDCAVCSTQKSVQCTYPDKIIGACLHTLPDSPGHKEYM